MENILKALQALGVEQPERFVTDNQSPEALVEAIRQGQRHYWANQPEFVQSLSTSQNPPAEVPVPANPPASTTDYSTPYRELLLRNSLLSLVGGLDTTHGPEVSLSVVQDRLQQQYKIGYDLDSRQLQIKTLNGQAVLNASQSKPLSNHDIVRNILAEAKLLKQGATPAPTSPLPLPDAGGAKPQSNWTERQPKSMTLSEAERHLASMGTY
jgi:hypothetical protein